VPVQQQPPAAQHPSKFDQQLLFAPRFMPPQYQVIFPWLQLQSDFSLH